MPSFLPAYPGAGEPVNPGPVPQHPPSLVLARRRKGNVGGLATVTGWPTPSLSRLGYAGSSQTVTPGSGTRGRNLSETEQQILSTGGATGGGPARTRFHYTLPCKNSGIPY